MTLHDIDLEEETATTTFDRAHVFNVPSATPASIAAMMATSAGLQVPPAPPRAAPPPPPRTRATAIPPPLPVSLRKRIAFGDEEWLASLPVESRAVLEAATMPARPWPYAERVVGAVCTPIV